MNIYFNLPLKLMQSKYTFTFMYTDQNCLWLSCFLLAICDQLRYFLIMLMDCLFYMYSRVLYFSFVGYVWCNQFLTVNIFCWDSEQKPQRNADVHTNFCISWRRMLIFSSCFVLLYLFISFLKYTILYKASMETTESRYVRKFLCKVHGVCEFEQT